MDSRAGPVWPTEFRAGTPELMSFPQTRLTLVQRLVTDGHEEDWRQFLTDYWGPICRFALRWGAGTMHDAEEVASQTFEVIWRNRLLERWVSNRSARSSVTSCVQDAP